MSQIQKKGLVLKKINYGESDLIITFFTEEGEKLKAFAPKARKSRQRFPNLDLFNYLEITYNPAKESSSLSRLNSAECVLGMISVHQDLRKFATASYFSELILEFLPDGLNSKEIFESFFSFLKGMNGSEPLLKALIPMMEHHFLDLSGYKPMLDNCLSCRQKVRKEESYVFDGMKGGVLCRSCRQERNHSSQRTPEAVNTFPMSPDLIDRLRQLKPTHSASQSYLSWQDQDILQARQAFEYFIQYTAGKPFKSLQFLTKILS